MTDEQLNLLLAVIDAKIHEAVNRPAVLEPRSEVLVKKLRELVRVPGPYPFNKPQAGSPGG